MENTNIILNEEKKRKIIDEINRFELFRRNYIVGTLFLGRAFRMTASDLEDIRHKIIGGNVSQLTDRQKEIVNEIVEGKVNLVKKTAFLYGLLVIWLIVVSLIFINFIANFGK